MSVTSLVMCFTAFGVNVYRVLQSSDTAWIVRTGQYIITTGKLPEHDLFSWTCTQCHWVVYQWLFECAAGALFMAGGLWLVGLVVSILVAIVFLYLLPRQWLSLGIPVFVTFTFAALALTPHCFFARPQCVSYALMAVFASILEATRTTGKTRMLWLLPPLMVIWANCHSFWFIGLIMIAAYCLDAWLAVLLRPVSGAGLHRNLAVTLVLPVAAICVLINPYGAALVTYDLTFLNEPDFVRIHELRPLLEEPAEGVGIFLVYLVASWVLIFWRRAAVPSAGLFLLMAGTIPALLMKRFAAVAAIIIWPFLGLAIADLKVLRQRFPAPIDAKNPLPTQFARLHRIFTDASGRLRRLPHLGTLIVVVVAMWLYNFPDPQKVWFTHSGNRRAAVEFLRTVNLGPRVFNDASGGCSMILAGCLPVFIDTRFDMYGKNFCEEWQSCVDAKPGWQQYLERMKITHIFIRRFSPLDRALKKSRDWLCIYDDHKSAIWVNRSSLKNGSDTL